MRYIIMGKNLEISDRTKEKITDKLDRLKKLFPEDAVATVKVGAYKLDHTIEVTVPVNKRIIRAETCENDMMAAVDKAVDVLEKQVIKYKKRMLKKYHKNVSYKEEYESINVDESAYEDIPDVKIEKSKRFEIRPMDAEEAVMQMELLGHNFFVFRNGETEAVNIVYKRKDGTFGLIEPE